MKEVVRQFKSLLKKTSAQVFSCFLSSPHYAGQVPGSPSASSNLEITLDFV